MLVKALTLRIFPLWLALSREVALEDGKKYIDI
jgi:hypothetical protein